jgi:predicted RNase H-like HicB family nuclease
MKSRFNIVIEKNEIGYSASCPEMEKYKVTATSLDLVIDSLKSAIELTNYPAWLVLVQ